MKVELTYKNFQKKKISYLKMRWLTTEKHSNELCQTKQTHQTIRFQIRMSIAYIMKSLLSGTVQTMPATWDFLIQFPLTVEAKSAMLDVIEFKLPILILATCYEMESNSLSSLRFSNHGQKILVGMSVVIVEEALSGWKMMQTVSDARSSRDTRHTISVPFSPCVVSSGHAVVFGRSHTTQIPISK